MEQEKGAGTEITPEGEGTLPTPESKIPDAGDSPPSPVDYRAELEAERAKVAKKEKEAENYRKRALIAERRAVRPRTEDDELPEVEPEDQTDIIAEKVAQRLAPTFLASTLDQEIGRYSDNPDLQALIRFHYENSLARSGLDAGSVREDVRKAALIANAPRVSIERDEALRVAAQRKTPPLGGSGRGPEEETPRKSYGWTKEQVEKMNAQHKLATGKEFTEAELTRSWELAKTGRATAEISR